MKLPLYEGPKPFSRIEICQDALRKEVTSKVNELLEKHNSVREVESMCSVLDGVRDTLASMALDKKRREQNKIKIYELIDHFQNGFDISFVAPKAKVYMTTPKKFEKLTQGTKGKKANGSR